MRGQSLFFVPILLLFLSGCATAYNPATNMREARFFSTPQEVSIGRSAAVQVARRYRLTLGPAYMNRVIKVGRRIAAASDRQDIQYRFGVVLNDEVNAFSLPGGYVYVNTGVLKRATDDELAGVLAHEIGHIAARHHMKRIETDMTYDLLTSLIFIKLKDKGVRRAVNTSFKLIELGYSREDEFFADSLAIRYLDRAGFNPNAMVTFLEKLAKLQGSGPDLLVYLRSHPYPEERIRHAKEEIASPSPSLRSGSGSQ